MEKMYLSVLTKLYDHQKIKQRHLEMKKIIHVVASFSDEKQQLFRHISSEVVKYDNLAKAVIDPVDSMFITQRLTLQ